MHPRPVLNRSRCYHPRAEMVNVARQRTTGLSNLCWKPTRNLRQHPIASIPSGLTEKLMKTLTTHYIDGEFVSSHGQDVMDIIRPTDRKVLGRLTLADEEDTRRAIAAARRSFATYR